MLTFSCAGVWLVPSCCAPVSTARRFLLLPSLFHSCTSSAFSRHERLEQWSSFHSTAPLQSRHISPSISRHPPTSSFFIDIYLYIYRGLNASHSRSPSPDFWSLLLMVTLQPILLAVIQINKNRKLTNTCGTFKMLNDDPDGFFSSLVYILELCLIYSQFCASHHRVALHRRVYQRLRSKSPSPELCLPPGSSHTSSDTIRGDLLRTTAEYGYAKWMIMLPSTSGCEFAL
jgi:hypothetical protein